MGVFSYTALDREGRRLTGTLPADCAQMNMRSGLPLYFAMFASTHWIIAETSLPPSSQFWPGWRCMSTPTIPFFVAQRPMLS